ncbi:MAG: NUDIX hydrolase [Gammaproteobacteria bacterium]
MQTDESLRHPEPAVGIGGIVFNSHNQVLLIKRDKPPAKGLWSVPGGRLEPGESMVEACRREFKEETGLAIEVEQVVAVVERRIENYHYVIIDFLARLQDQASSMPVAQSDVAEAKWVDVSDIAGYPMVDGLAEIIKRCCLVADSDQIGGLFDNDSTGTDFILNKIGNADN